MTNRQRGKNTERAIAKKIEGQRVGILGKEDVSHSVFSFEIKSRKAFVAQKWMLQAIRNCPKDKIPACIVHIHNKNHDSDLVIMRLSDFQDWLGEIKRKKLE